MDSTKFSKPISLKRIQLDDGFWKPEMELVRTEVIPYQWETLNDRVPEAAPSYCMHNFKVAGDVAGIVISKAYEDEEEMLYVLMCVPVTAK